MTLEERVRRLERLAIGETTTATEEIRRDLAAKSEVCEHGVRLGGKCARCCEDRPYGRDAACHCGHGSLDHNSVAGRKCCQPGCLCRRFRPAEPRDSDVDALRAQVADLTRERDSMVREAQRRGETIVEAVARAEKAERERDEANAKAETYRSDWYAAKNEFGDAAGKLRAEIRARDATIAEARAHVAGVAAWMRQVGHEWPAINHETTCFCCRKVGECEAWLAGQPAPKPKEMAFLRKRTRRADRRTDRALTERNRAIAERDAARAEVAAEAIEEAALVACHLCRQGIPRYPYKSDPGNEQHRVGGADGVLRGECRAVKIRALAPAGLVAVSVDDLRCAMGECGNGTRAGFHNHDVVVDNIRAAVARKEPDHAR